MGGVEVVDEDDSKTVINKNGKAFLTMKDPKMLFTSPVEYDFNSSSIKMETLIKKYSKNYHKNLLDLRMLNDIKKMKIARMLKAVEDKLHQDVVDYTNRLTKFKSNIKTDEGKLSLSDLKKLNSVYKRNYADQILKENFETRAYCNYVDENLLEK